MKILYRNNITFIVLTLGLLLTNIVKAVETPPKLVLQITVDQLRADLPQRFKANMGAKGFKFLYKNGIVYKNANHTHANTETIVGHVTLATGATPSMHGMIGNIWFDRQEKRLIYNIEDASYPLLDKNADVNKQTEIDPTQRTARSSGRSPSNIKVSTFSDELINLTDGKSKVFSVSVKDRGAISMAGHNGKAFWFSKSTGDFITSSYYYDSLPKWVNTWNKKDFHKNYSDKAWELSLPANKYMFADKTVQTKGMNYLGFNDSFPHPYGSADNKYFSTFLTLSPAGDEITVDFAKTVLLSEELGKDDVTDYLAISFSSTDYVGHMFGSSSIEMEDNIKRLDETLADLLNYVDKHVGLEHTLIVLSADHGGADTIAYNKSKGLDAAHVKPITWQDIINVKGVEAELGTKQPLVKSYNHPYVYLDFTLIKKLKLHTDDVATVIAKAIEQLHGVALAVPSHLIEKGQYSDSLLYRSIANNYDNQRSGEIFVVLKPYYFINDMEGLSVAAHHGSPWRYDTQVPIIFAGHNINPTTVVKSVSTIDIAPTLATYVGTKLPSGNEGIVLPELFKSHE